jgi:hypothetical protein
MIVRPKFRVVSYIYEEGADYPVVTHVFCGMTAEQAQRTYRAHQKTDAFLRGCIAGRFGEMKCKEEHKLQRWSGASWI